jgi:hypothetical protein
MMSEATTAALKKYGEFLAVVEEKIMESLSQSKSLAATKLAKDVGPSFGWEWPQAYHFINAYVDERSELFVKKGPKGGITLKEGYVWDAENKVAVKKE